MPWLSHALILEASVRIWKAAPIALGSVIFLLVWLTFWGAGSILCWGNHLFIFWHSFNPTNNILFQAGRGVLLGVRANLVILVHQAIDNDVEVANAGVLGPQVEEQAAHKLADSCRKLTLGWLLWSALLVTVWLTLFGLAFRLERNFSNWALLDPIGLGFNRDGRAGFRWGVIYVLDWVRGDSRVAWAAGVFPPEAVGVSARGTIHTEVVLNRQGVGSWALDNFYGPCLSLTLLCKAPWLLDNAGGLFPE